MTTAEFCEQRLLRYHAVSPSTRQEYGYAVKDHVDPNITRSTVYVTARYHGTRSTP